MTMEAMDGMNADEADDESGAQMNGMNTDAHRWKQTLSAFIRSVRRRRTMKVKHR